mgnify:CR=1 FL=1
MPAATRPRSLQRGVELQSPTRLQERRRVVLPVGLVEVGGEEVARFVWEQRVHAGDERLVMLVFAREMPANHVIRYGQKATVRALGALDPRLFADATDPLVRAGRRVS